MLDLYFGPGACAGRRSRRLCSLRFSQAQQPSVTVAESSPNPQQNVVHLTLGFSPVGELSSVAFEGAVMRIIILAAVLAVSSALGGCFHFHTSQVYSAPQALPPLK
jgi:hypothetical protein